MATWNGSCQGSEDSNYLLYSDQNSGGYNVDSWTFYSRNDAYFPNASVPYSQNESAMFEQREPTAFCQISSNVSSNPSTSMSLPDTQHQGYYQLNVPHNRLPNNVQCYQKDNSHLQNISTYSYQNNNHGKRTKSHKNNSKYTLPQENNDNTCNIVERSNLHATANEFIPHGIKLNSRENRSKDENTLVNDNASEFYLVDCVPQTVKNTFTSDDMDRQERRHDFKRDTAYKQRDIEDNQYYRKGAYKNSYRMHNNKNYGKFQNDRYYNSRQYTENPRKKIQGEDKRNLNVSPNVSIDCSSGHKSSTSIECEQGDEFTNSQVAQSKNRMLMFKGRHNMDDQRRMCEKSIDKNNSLKAVSDKSSENDYYKHNFNSGLSRTSGKTLRKSSNDHRIDRFENNYRERRNVYQDYNDHKTVHSEGNKIDKSKDKDRSKDSSVENKEREVVNWRYKGESSTKNNVQKRGQNKKYEDDDASQRERLTEQLNKGQLECLVCCEYIKQNDYIWSCTNCYHVLHLKCIKKWAKSSHSDNGWRCPACQNVNCAMPKDYFCFCGKTKMPEWNRRDIAHSCGEICGRSRSKNNCAHKCTLLCHPGSCPLCIAMVTKYCGCGKTSQTLKCSTATLLLCDSVCGKILDCEKHMCEKKCHHGECGPCEKSILQECFCGKSKREITCKPDLSFAYSCENVCEKLLDCKNHKCQKICHSSECEPCSLTPDKVTTCYCAQTLLTEERKCCLDPIPTCDKICSKQLKCGQPSNPHTCKVNCHEGECPDCELTTDVRCRCGNMDREIACKDLTFKADDAQCEKKCIKKRSCGKHKCNQLCCIDIEHVCPLICFKTLSCGRHKCEQTCHKGRCQPCWRSSFDELYCECGTAVIYPPVPCGTRRPICDKPCLRSHPCGHEVLHNCHSEPTCPPCTVLTQKWCYGKHELRKAVPCYVNEVSCGLPCNKPLSCGRHKCITICHPGSCEKPGQNCIQPCTTLRELCGHICAAPCHDGKCPDTPCKEMVKVTCQCGHRSTTRVCAENAREYQRIASNILASKMADMQLGHSIDLEEVFGQGAKKQNQLKSLECNDECKLIERNRRLALGLQIVNPDLSGKLMPRYSEYMKQWAKKDSHFCQMVHDKLTELVQLAKTSKQKSRSYSFDSMNKDKRHFVHESCEHFGCESQAYDQEPKRNVVATAIKHKCWLPSYSLLEMMQRENGQRKVPGPMLNTSKGNNSTKTILALPAKRNSKPLPTPSTSRSPEPEIDYFDYKG